MPAHLFCSQRIYRTLTGTQSHVNLWTVFGSPTKIVDAVCTIDGGAIIYGPDEFTEGLLVPADFVVGSVITLLFRGNAGLYGGGGKGGGGGSAPYGQGTAGRAGGPALSIYRPVQISLAGGFIFGGGGGGSGHNATGVAGGDGGGGGQGYVGGDRGLGGSGLMGNGRNGTQGDFYAPGRPNGKAWGSDAAIESNGQTITWLDGGYPDNTRLKGSVI